MSYQGRPHPAHRVIAHLVLGWDLDGDFEVMHTCNYKPCCNWRHFQKGTHLENMLDASKDGLLARHGGGGVPISTVPEWAQAIAQRWQTSRVKITQ